MREDFLDDPRFDDAAVDFTMVQLCKVLGVDSESVRWDAATETFTGDVQAVISNILTAKFGDDWDSKTSIFMPPSSDVSPLGKEYLEKRVACMQEAVDRQEYRQNDGDASRAEYWIGRLHEAKIALTNLTSGLERAGDGLCKKSTK